MERVRARMADWELVQKDDGRVYLRRPGKPDVAYPYSAENAEVCVSTAVYKYGWILLEDNQ